MKILSTCIAGIFLILCAINIKAENSPQKTLEEISKKYDNLITWERIQENQDTDKIRPAKALPLSVLKTFKKVDLNLALDFEPIIESNSPYVVVEETDIFEVFYKDQVLGYIFNVTECTEEECSGWNALYTNEKGEVVKKTF